MLSRVRSLSLGDVSFPMGVPEPEPDAEEGVGAMPRISAIEASDFEAIDFEAMARARWLPKR